MTKEEFKNLSKEDKINLYIENECNFSLMDRKFGFTKNTSERVLKSEIDCLSIRKNLKEEEKRIYLLSPNVCIHCGKPLSWNKRNNKFCCSSCSASYNNKLFPKRKKSPEQKKTKTKRASNSEKDKSRRHNYRMMKYHPDLEFTPIKPGCCSICGKPNCSDDFCKDHSVRDLMVLVKYLGFDSRKLGTTECEGEFNRVRGILFEMYLQDEMSVIEIHKHLIKSGVNISQRMVYDLFRLLNIERRSNGESLRLSIKTGRVSLPSPPREKTKYVSGYHKTWDDKNVFLRSSYEFDFARFLDEKRVLYEVENLRIEYFDTTKNILRIAIPDFYLPETNEIVEIKSKYTLILQEMKDKFKSYVSLGYIPKLILDHKEVNLDLL